MEMLIFYMILAIGVSFLCSLMESILLSLNISYIQVLKNTNPAAGARLEEIKKDISKPLAAILILNTCANTIGAAGVGAEAAKIFGSEYMFYISALLTLLILFISEIIPKTIGAVHWKSLAPVAAVIIKFFIFITYPLILISLFITKKISKNQKEQHITREELLASAQLGENEGIIDEQESDVIENILQLDKHKIIDILTPRSVVFALEKNVSIERAIKTIGITKFSRIPIYDKSIDNIIGVVMSKKIFQRAIEEKSESMETLMKPIYTINENIPVSFALDLFIKRKEHMFLVTDKYGQTAGIVTLEDCVETVLGVEIMDELDTTENMQVLAKEKHKKQKEKRKKEKELKNKQSNQQK